MLLKLAWVGGSQRKGIWVPIEKKDILKEKLQQWHNCNILPPITV
jgi:hypothetical protein